MNPITTDQLREWANIPTGLARLLCTFAEQEEVSVRKLRGESRVAALVRKRREFARLADDCGFAAASIGRALNRDHSTILHHLKDRLA